jgi:Carboxypeptidase regulatory-like domain
MVRNIWKPVLWVASLLLAGVVAYADAPLTKITIQVKTASGRPIEQADVIVRFVKGHSVFKLGKAVRTQWELRTNQEGEAVVPEIPQGQIRIQVIAKGYQTYGNTFDVVDPEKTLPIIMNPPQQQYSSH